MDAHAHVSAQSGTAPVWRLAVAADAGTVWPAERVREHIRAEAGRQFDPELVALFLASTPQG